MMRRLVLILSVYALLIGVMLVAVCARAQWRANSVWWESTDETANTWRGLHLTSLKSGISLFGSSIDFEVPGRARAWVIRERVGLRPDDDDSRHPFRASPDERRKYRAFMDGGGRLPHGFTQHETGPPGTYRPGAGDSSFSRLGFTFRRHDRVREGAVDGGDFIPSDGPRSYRYSDGYASYWALILPFLIVGLPAVRAYAASRRRARRVAAGRCPSCGYDVRETPERCPECGAAPDVRPVALTARLLGRHASAVHACVSLLMAAAIGFVLASACHDQYEWTGVSLALIFLGVLIKMLIGTVYERDGRLAT